MRYSNNDYSNTLPSIIYHFIMDICRHYQVDLSLVIPIVLSMCSALMHDKVKVQIEDPVTGGAFQEPLSVFTIAFAESSARKSQVMKWFRRAIETQLAQQNVLLEKRKIEQNALKNLAKASIKKLQKEIIKHPSESPRRKSLTEELIVAERVLNEPSIEPRRLFLQDATCMAAAKFMHTQEGNAFMVMDAEGVAFDSISMDHGFLELLLSGYSNERTAYERASRPSVDIASPHAGLCILTQPAKLQKLAAKKNLWDEGFIPRTLFFFCPDLAGFREVGIAAAISQESTEWWESRCKALLELQYKYDTNGNRDYYTLHLSQDAAKEWRYFSGELEGMMRRWTETYPLRTWLGKMAGVANRIAAFFHFLDSNQSVEEIIETPIQPLHMRQACNLIMSLVPHMLEVHDIFFPADTSLEDAVHKIVNWLNQESGTVVDFKLREMYRELSIEKNIAYDACNYLESCGVLNRRIIRSDRPGRRGTPIYDVNYYALHQRFPLRRY